MPSNYYMELISSPSHFIIGVIASFLYFLYWHRRPYKFPPGPRGIPVLGYLPFLNKQPELTALKLSQKYGPVLSIRLGSQDVVFLNDHSSTYDVFVKQGSKTSGRAPFPPLKPLCENVGMLFLNYGRDFKSQKKFGFSTLRGFGVGKRGMEIIAQEELFYLTNEIQSKNENPIDYSDLIHCAIANNVCAITLGRRFEYHDDDFKKHLKVILSSFTDPKLGLANNIITFLPYLRHVPPFSTYNKMYLDSVKDFFAWIHEFIEEHKQTYDEHSLRDFIDVYFEEMSKSTDSSFTESQLFHYISDLFVAGTETTSSSILWALICLIHFPQAQSRLRKEVLQVFGSSGAITTFKRSQMPYTNAFLQEVQRYRIVAPLTLPHLVMEDVEHNNYIIPKGTLVFSNITAVHNDPKLWSEPSKFKPERFLDEKGNFISSNHVISFSLGPRRCLGEQLATMEIFVFVVGMVQKFELLPDPNEDSLPSIDDGVRSLTFAPKPFKMIAKEYDS